MFRPLLAAVLALALPLAGGCGLTPYGGTLDTGPTGAVAVCDPAQVEFGNHDIAGNPAYKEVLIKSIGSERVAITDVRVKNENGDAFSIYKSSDLPLPKSILPGNTFRFKLEFIPKELRQYTGTVTIVTDESGEEVTFECSVTGAGCETSSGDPCPS